MSRTARTTAVLALAAARPRVYRSTLARRPAAYRAQSRSGHDNAPQRASTSDSNTSSFNTYDQRASRRVGKAHIRGSRGPRIEVALTEALAILVLPMSAN